MEVEECMEVCMEVEAMGFNEIIEKAFLNRGWESVNMSNTLALTQNAHGDSTPDLVR